MATKYITRIFPIRETSTQFWNEIVTIFRPQAEFLHNIKLRDVSFLIRFWMSSVKVIGVGSSKTQNLHSLNYTTRRASPQKPITILSWSVAQPVRCKPNILWLKMEGEGEKKWTGLFSLLMQQMENLCEKTKEHHQTFFSKHNPGTDQMSYDRHTRPAK